MKMEGQEQKIKHEEIVHKGKNELKEGKEAKEEVIKENKQIDTGKIVQPQLAKEFSEKEKKEAILDKEPIRRVASKKEKWGILFIYSSYNNTHLHVTDITGSETIAKVTGGMVTKSDRLKATPNAAMAAAKQVSEMCHAAGITSLYVKLRAVGGHNGPMSPGPGAQASIRMLTRYGIKLGRIEDVTPTPHDSCRKKGGKRGRRV